MVTPGLIYSVVYNQYEPTQNTLINTLLHHAKAVVAELCYIQAHLCLLAAWPLTSLPYRGMLLFRGMQQQEGRLGADRYSKPAPTHAHTILAHTDTHTMPHTQCTTLPTFIQLIFLAAIAFNWSHSGPLPWPSADERAHSVLHYPLSFQHCRQWSWERTVKGYYRPDNWKMSRLQDVAVMPCLVVTKPPFLPDVLLGTFLFPTLWFQLGEIKLSFHFKLEVTFVRLPVIRMNHFRHGLFNLFYSSAIPHVKAYIHHMCSPAFIPARQRFLLHQQAAYPKQIQSASIAWIASLLLLSVPLKSDGTFLLFALC